jgi:hypothetical protein
MRFDIPLVYAPALKRFMVLVGARMRPSPDPVSSLLFRPGFSGSETGISCARLTTMGVDSPMRPQCRAANLPRATASLAPGRPCGSPESSSRRGG